MIIHYVTHRRFHCPNDFPKHLLYASIADITVVADPGPVSDPVKPLIDVASLPAVIGGL